MLIHLISHSNKRYRSNNSLSYKRELHVHWPRFCTSQFCECRRKFLSIFPIVENVWPRPSVFTKHVLPRTRVCLFSLNMSDHERASVFFYWIYLTTNARLSFSNFAYLTTSAFPSVFTKRVWQTVSLFSFRFTYLIMTAELVFFYCTSTV